MTKLRPKDRDPPEITTLLRHRIWIPAFAGMSGFWLGFNSSRPRAQGVIESKA